MSEPLLSVTGLTKRYPMRSGLLRHRNLVAADGVSLSLQPGETLALVGESGSGKSTVGRCILRLEDPDSGQVRINGREISAMQKSEVQKLRPQMQMVYQDPLESLNPRRRVGTLVAEPLHLHSIVSRSELKQQVASLFRLVGLSEEHVGRYPHELSGGQQQRVGIARALATSPKLLVLDEPTSALDVSVEAQIVNLLSELQQRLKLAYLFISHNLAVVSMLADRVAVMYLGQIVEVGPTREVLGNGFHPYTRALVSATPVDHPRQKKQRISLDGEPTSPIDPPAHCRLAGRCPFVQEACTSIVTNLENVAARRATRCVRFQQEHQNGHWNPEPAAAS